MPGFTAPKGFCPPLDVRSRLHTFLAYSNIRYKMASKNAIEKHLKFNIIRNFFYPKTDHNSMSHNKRTLVVGLHHFLPGGTMKVRQNDQK